MRTLPFLAFAALAVACTPLPDVSDDDGAVAPDDEDGDGKSGDADCDDADATVYVGAPELCDEIDNDCDGAVDDDPSDPTTWYADEDEDGYGDPTAARSACDAPEGYVAAGDDCNDVDERVHPGAEESDCTDPVDYNCDGSSGYDDNDEDGFPACQDCADADPIINPDALEYCNEIDDNCDGTTDEGSAVDARTYFADTDDDGYGNPESTDTFCSLEAGWSLLGTDCDDADAREYPGADEYCDGDDDDCDAEIDEDAAVDAKSWYDDDDGDSYGDPLDAHAACSAPAGTVADDSDCDDGNATEYPGADEYCDGDDDDCDGDVDEDEALDAQTWYADTDGDSFGDELSVTLACSLPEGYSATDTDCDDTDAQEYPGADEYCDGDDDDCDGQTDENESVDASTWYRDADNDGYGNASSSSQACSAPSGYVADDDDCNDLSGAIHPAATESVGDSVDQNCDGSESCYADADNDLYRASTGATVTSSDSDCADSGEATSSDATGDCDDADSAVNPGAEETCNDTDDDCDGEVDWGLRVPTDRASLTAAITASANGDTVCVDSGTYTERIDLGGKLITLLGVDGAARTIISGGGTGPVVTIDGGEDARTTLDGFTITKGSSTAGAGMYIYGSSPTIQNVIITENTCSTTTSSCAGTGVYVAYGDPSFDNVEITENSQSASGSSSAYASGAGAYLAGSRATFTDSLIQANYQYASGTYPQTIGCGLYASSSSLTLASVDIIENEQTIAPSSSTSYGYAYGTGVYLNYHDGYASAFTDVHIEDNTAMSSGGYYGQIYGVGMYASYYADPVISDSTFDGNYAYGTSTYTYAYGGGLYLYNYTDATITNTEITENWIATTGAYGGGLYVYYYSNPTLTNVIVAGNQAGTTSSTAQGGGMSSGYYSIPVVTNSSIVSNVAKGTYAYGGGISVDYYGGLDMLNTDVSANTLTASYAYGGAMYVYSASYLYSMDLDYNNFYGNTSSEFYNYTSPVGTEGNVNKKPGYSDTTSGDSALWDLTLTASSSLRNIGDSALTDPDGSRSDIGAHGGPGGEDW